MTTRVPLSVLLPGLVLELDIDPFTDRIDTAWWSLGGETFAEVLVGRA